jgi:cytochrome P450
LTQNPQVLKKLEQELDEAGLLVTRSRPVPRDLQYSDLSKLTYLEWVLKESMRVMPVIGGAIAREALCDLNLNGYTVPKGTLLLIAIHATHHHPDNWDRPDDFVPVPHSFYHISLTLSLCLQARSLSPPLPPPPSLVCVFGGLTVLMLCM